MKTSHDQAVYATKEFFVQDVVSIGNQIISPKPRYSPFAITKVVFTVLAILNSADYKYAG